MTKICPIECRNGAISVLKKLRDAGFETYFAGGCVRDRLLCDEPLEYDIATNAKPDEIKAVFPHARSVGEVFGVMLVKNNGYMYDVATFRSDGPYSDNRHPDEIRFTDAKHDAERRDFTINGMFEDPLEDRIIDFIKGRKDIDLRLIRAIGDPKKRFAEDHLRMLRAIRFASRFSFAIETETADAIRELAHELIGVSKERIGEELRKMLTNENRGVAAWEVQYLGLDRAIFDEESCLKAPTRVSRLHAKSHYATAIAAWILDRYGTETDLRGIAEHWQTQLLLPNKVFEAVFETLTIHQKLFEWDSIGIASKKRIAQSEQCDGAMTILHAEDSSMFVHIRRGIIELEKTGIAPERLINGHDLLEAGVKPSPELGNILEAVYDAQLEGSVTTRHEAITLALAIYRDSLDA